MQEEKHFSVYLMTNKPRGVFYVGVSSALIGRVGEHRAGELEGFSKKWRLRRLVWYEAFPDADSAISFEKKLKRWRRPWKIELVETSNPEWRDLWPELTGEPPDRA